MCNKNWTLMTKAEITEHFLTVHNMPLPKQLFHYPKRVQGSKICPECNQEFAIVGNMHIHYLKEHKDCPVLPEIEQKKKFICEICSQMLTTKKGLRRHHELVHQNIRPVFHRQCDHCGKTFKKRTNYIEHVRSKHENNTPFECDSCGKKFGTRSCLSKHKSMAHKRFNCGSCDKVLSSLYALRRHEVLDHGIISKKAIQCDQCSLIFHSSEMHKKHRENVHETFGDEKIKDV